MRGLYESLSAKDRAKVDSWVKARKEPQHDRDIPTEFYLMAELGFYYGWEAVRDFRRGFTLSYDAKGKQTNLSFTFEDAVAFVEAAKKVQYLNAGQVFRK